MLESLKKTRLGAKRGSGLSRGMLRSEVDEVDAAAADHDDDDDDDDDDEDEDEDGGDKDEDDEADDDDYTCTCVFEQRLLSTISRK